MGERLTRLLCIGLLIALAACVGHRGYRQAKIAEQFGDWDEAVLQYLQLVDEFPHNISYRTGLLRAKIKASQVHFEKAKKLQEADALERALFEFEQAVQLDPTNQYAQVEYAKLRDAVATADRGIPTDMTLDELKAKNRGSRPQPPVLNPRSREPISLEFPKPVSVFNIYRALGKAFGINILFDPKLRDQQIAIELQDVIAQDALEILMRTANHFYKVLDEHTIIVAEDNPQNRRNYEDLVIQTFFLSNAEVKDVMTMLRSLVGAKNVAANDQLNAIVLRDTADKVKVAERIISTNDKSRGEVVIDVELLQINTSKLRDLGVSLSQYQVTQSLDPNPSRASDLEFINQGNWILSLPAFIYDFVKNSSEAQLLASPQVRISDGEQATLHIGDRVPIPVTTFNTGQTLQGNIIPITSFQYQDVGIRLDLEPRIHHNKEISLKLTVEVSNLSGFVEGTGGQRQPIIGTRTIESTIRLKNGETNFLAGLIRSDETNRDSGVPGISEIPILGRLFSRKSTDNQRTDLVLTMTPHIVRTPDITEEDLLPIWVGTEANITFRGGSPRVESEVEGPFDEEDDSGAARIREMIRRRLQNLPRGLRDAAEGDEEEEAQPGIELAPAAPPRDLFQQPTPPPPDEDEEDGPEPRSLIILPPESEPFLLEEPPPAVEDEMGAPRAELGEPEEFAVMAGVGALPAAPSTTGVELSLLAASGAVEVGTVFEVRLVVEAGKPVSHLPITLSWDPARLELDEVRAGGFLGSASEAQVLTDSSRPGRLVVGASRLGEAPGITGGGVAAEVAFRAVALGEAWVRFERAKALSAGLEGVGPVITRPLRIDVVRPGELPPPPPEPAREDGGESGDDSTRPR